MRSGNKKNKSELQTYGPVLQAEVVAIYLGLLDLALLFASSVSIYAIYVGWDELSSAYLAIASATSLVAITTFSLTDLYRLDAIIKPTRHLGRIVLMLSLVFLITVAFLFALKQSAVLSRVWMFSWYLIGTSLVILGRIAVSAFLFGSNRAKRLGCNIIVVGAGEHGRQLIRHLESAREPWNQIVGVFDDRTERVGNSIEGFPRLGNLDDLVGYARVHRCDQVLVALPWEAEGRIMDIANRLSVLPIHISLSPDFTGLGSRPTRFRNFAGIPVLEIFRNPMAGRKAILKRMEDCLIGGVIMVAMLPVMLIIAVLIKLDSRGPVLFRQSRYGFNNQLIEVYKFRTMKVDALDQNGNQLTTRNDPRVTRIGRFLRHSSLDELPQFYNVLKGEMSVVGPRPHALQAKAGSRLYQDVVAEYASRHRVKPGVTGWAQINGWRGVTDRDEQIRRRVDYDLYYIENWSLGLDLQIILRTIPAVLGRQNAV